jgi:sugar phosphate permease
MLADWKLLLYALMYFIQASSVYSLAFFAPIILMQGLGFEYAKAQLLSSPPYVFTIFASIAGAWVSDKMKMRWPVLTFQALVAIVGLLVVLYAQPPAARYFGLFLATYGTQGQHPHLRYRPISDFLQAISRRPLRLVKTRPQEWRKRA